MEGNYVYLQNYNYRSSEDNILIMKKLYYLCFAVLLLYCSCDSSIVVTCEVNEEDVIEVNKEDANEVKREYMEMSRPEDAYNYPVYPGTEEWANLKNGQEMKDACQVPVSVLKKQSTQAVIQALWDYPLLFETLHRYEYQLDFESFFLDNNAYKELLSRKDAGRCLFDRYISLVPDARYKISALELLISQEKILSQLDDIEKKALIKEVFEKDAIQQDDPQLANRMFRSTMWLLCGKVLLAAKYTPFIELADSNENLKEFLYSDSYVYMKQVYEDIPQIIINHCDHFTNPNLR